MLYDFALACPVKTAVSLKDHKSSFGSLVVSLLTFSVDISILLEVSTHRIVNHVGPCIFGSR